LDLNPGVLLRRFGGLEADAGELHAVIAGKIGRSLVARFGMAHDAGAWIIRQDTLETARSIFRAIGDNDHARML
jgi:hypothetical protein